MKMREMKTRTKIICTMGPSVHEVEGLRYGQDR